MPKARFKKYQLHFKTPVLTSRGAMQVKNGYFLFISDGVKTGIGECSYIEGLSPDDLNNYEHALEILCRKIETGSDDFPEELNDYPSIRFGWETARLDFANGGKKILFESSFTAGTSAIPINGLVWMGEKEFMLGQVKEKLDAGFRCIKIKVGAIDFEQELELLKFVRGKFPPDVIEIRLDANGAFSANDVFNKLERLATFEVHSIEQPVKQGQLELMKKVCSESPIAVALDEELIKPQFGKQELLDFVKPQYIILKPSLLGGFKASEEWIAAAQRVNAGWWATSALESNIGLNAIAQWVYTKKAGMVQGLGTGSLYTDNIRSPLYIDQGKLGYDIKAKWGDVI